MIFKPGLSSAEKSSAISGRGVGMDLVRSTIKGCRGSIAVDSVLGEGTTVTLTIPSSC